MNPSVAAVMLVSGRPEMVKRAIDAFRAQTYDRKFLMLYDTGEHDALVESVEVPGFIEGCWRANYCRTIGALRNDANGFTTGDVIVHWDSDDWSHPERIAEQVALLKSSKKQCVGYREMLFWRDPEAWLYSNPRHQYCLGTSLCYWRSVWEARPFPDMPKAKGATGEDTEWLRGVDSAGIRAGDRMIASIHGGNTQYYGDDLIQPPFWRRVPDSDEYCREVMTL